MHPSLDTPKAQKSVNLRTKFILREDSTQNFGVNTFFFNLFFHKSTPTLNQTNFLIIWIDTCLLFLNDVCS